MTSETPQTDPYKIGGVTINAVGGGYYDLHHASLAEPERVRGRDVAEARAAELDAEAPIAPNPAPDDNLPLLDPTPPEPEPEAKAPTNPPSEYTTTLSKAEQKAVGVPMTRIVLEDNDDIPPTGLFLSHNYRPYMLMPGVEADVPNFLLEVLDNAVAKAPIVDPQTKRVIGHRDRMRFPYRRIA